MSNSNENIVQARLLLEDARINGYTDSTLDNRVHAICANGGIGALDEQVSEDDQESPVGKALFDLYYRNKVLHAPAPNPVGYPHNGGEHTPTISGPSEECSPLMAEAYTDIAPLIRQMQLRVAEHVSKSQSRGVLNIKDLCTLEAA